MARRFIRYLAATDNSPIGMLALGYLSGLLRIAPVRVGSMTGGMTGRWEHYAQLMGTPMDGEFVNVVCCAPERWTWEQRVTMGKRTQDGKIDPAGEVAVAQQSLYTSGVRNVLIAGLELMPRGARDAALSYEEIVVPDAVSTIVWTPDRLSCGMPPARLIQLPIVDHAALRSVVMP